MNTQAGKRFPGSKAVRILGLFLILPVLLAAFGCRSISVRETPETAVPMETVRIESDPAGEIPGKFWDAYSLFQKATRAFDEMRYAEAQSVYIRILKEFPESDLVPLSAYNQALCLEAMKAFPEAVAAYRQVIKEYSESVEHADILFRIGFCLESMEDWTRAAAVFGQEIPQVNLSPIKAAEAQVRYGIALHNLDRSQEAIGILRESLSEIKKLRRPPVRLADFYLGKGYFTLGEVYHQRFEEAPLDVPEEQQEQALNRKAELLLLARAQYVKAIRSYESLWMTASLCRIGQSYFQFYNDVLKAPVPEGMSLPETEEYRKKLRKQMSPVRRKALAAHQRNLKLSLETGVNNQWTEISKLQVEALADDKEK